MLNQSEYLRYSRQISLPEIGVSGQEKLKAASVAVVGMGGLGSPVALYLVAAGIGHLGIIDFDVVGISNLHRQILHTDRFLGASKTKSALSTLKNRNPFVKLTRHELRLDQENAMDVLRKYDIVVDCSDNFATRYLVNDACVMLGIPNIFGSVYQFQGQVSVFGCADGPCYRCLHPIPPAAELIPSCAESGVLGVLPGLIGSLQTNETLKLLLEIGQPLIGRMALIDMLRPAWEILSIPKEASCPLCSEFPVINELINSNPLCPEPHRISVEKLIEFKEHATPFFLLDVRCEQEATQLSMGADQRIAVDELYRRIVDLNVGLDDQIVVHCQTGIRSRRAVQVLRDAGFSRVLSLDGGVVAWAEKMGLP